MTTMDIPTNPDTRPLPDGWHQHYDVQRKSWYYVQISVMPPKVSYTHPAAPATVVTPATRSSKSSSGMSFKPSLSDLPSPPASGGNLSAAQQLYANSVLKSMPNATAPSIPAPELRQMPSPPPATGSPGNIPTPPPSTSPRVFPSFPTPSLYEGRESPSQQLPTNSSELYGNAVQPGSRSSSAQPQSSQGLVSGSIVSHRQTSGSENFELAAPPHTAPHRSQTFPAPAPPLKELSQDHRSSTFSTGYLDQRPPHTAPTLVTTARSPSQLYANALNAQGNSTAAPITPNIASPSFTSIGGNFTSPSLSNAYPSPISLQTSPTPLSPTGGYPFPQGMQNQNRPNASGQRTNQQAMQEMGKAFKQLGRAALKGSARTAVKVAKATAALSTRMPSGTMANIGSAVMNGDVVSALSSSFAGLSTANIGIDPSQLQAVLQGQPGADYQAIINALVVQQQQQASLLQQQQLQQLQLSPGTPLSPQQPQVNYTALIAELQRIQMVTNAKQQQAQTQQQLLAQHQQAALGKIQQGQQQHAQQVQQQAQQAAFAQIQQQHALSQMLAQQTGSQPAGQAHPAVYQPQPQTAAPSQGGLLQYSIQPQTTGQTNHLQNPGQQQQHVQQQAGQAQGGYQQQTGVPQYSIQPQQTGQSTTGVDAQQQQQAFAQQQQAFAQQQQQQAQQQAQMQADFDTQMQQQQQAQIQAAIDAQVQQQQAQMQAALDAQMQQQSIQQQQMQLQQAQMQAQMQQQMQASLPPNYTGFQAPQQSSTLDFLNSLSGQSQPTFDPSSLYAPAPSGGTDPSGGSSGLGALLSGFSSALSDNGTSSLSDSLSSAFSGTDSSSDAYAEAQMEMQQAQMQADILAQAQEVQQSALF